MPGVPIPTDNEASDGFFPDMSPAYPQISVSKRVMVDSAQSVFGPYVESNPDLAVVVLPDERLENESYNSIIFSGLLITLFIFYVILIYRYRSSIPLLFKIIVLRKGSEALTDQQGLLFRRFVNRANWMGAIAVVAAIVKLCFMVGDSVYIPEISSVPLLDKFMPLAAAGAVAAIVLYRLVAYVVMSLVGRDPDGIMELVGFNKMIFAASSMLFVPLVMAFGFLPDEISAGTVAVVLFPFLVSLSYYIFKSYQFFIIRKLSILQWFLYLCGVEILPVSYFVLLILRH